MACRGGCRIDWKIPKHRIFKYPVSDTYVRWDVCLQYDNVARLERIGYVRHLGLARRSAR